MEDRCSFLDSTTYSGYGIEKREDLKANSPGSSESSPGSRTSFFLEQVISTNLSFKILVKQLPYGVAESTDFPIFSNLKSPHGQVDGIDQEVEIPPFFNST